MSRSAGIRWGLASHDTLRAKHRMRLRLIYNELFAENERQRVAVATTVAQLANNYVASQTQVRSAIDRSAAGFTRLCEHSAKLAVVADALRTLGCNVDA